MIWKMNLIHYLNFDLSLYYGLRYQLMTQVNNLWNNKYTLKVNTQKLFIGEIIKMFRENNQDS